MVRRLVLALSVALNLVLAYCLIWGQQGAIEYKKMRERTSQLEERIAALDGDNLALSKEIRLLQSDEKYLEKVIRNRSNFVRGNEILYIFPDDGKSESPGAPPHEAKN